jgi:hypothetical protein
MNSIRFRLIVLFITATTTLLAAFGIYSRFQLSQSLESGFSQLTHATVTRLTVSLAGALWNLDQNSVLSILSAEMLQPEVSQPFGSSILTKLCTPQCHAMLKGVWCRGICG